MANAGARVLATDTARHYAAVNQSTGQSVATGLASFTPVLMQAETVDTDNIHDPVTNNSRLVIGTILGWWLISGSVAWSGLASIAAGETRRAGILKNGATSPGSDGSYIGFPLFTGTSGFVNVVIPPIPFQATASTDYIELGAAHDHGSAVTTVVSSGIRSSLTAIWLGP